MTPPRTKRPAAARAGGEGSAATPDPGPPLEQFIRLSVVLTGFDEAELQGTGMMSTYYDLIPSIVGDDMFGRLLTRWADLYIRGAGDPAFLEQLVEDELLADSTLGPLARNLAALWYLGMWNQLPAAWRNAHGARAGDATHVVSPQSYAQGLVWQAIHSHPPAAKQPGFASWALKPETGNGGAS